MADVIVIAGTADARQIVAELLKLDLKVAATVTTRFGSELLYDSPNLEIFEGKLSSEGMAAMICETKAKCLVDASHPYAKEASLNAIEACKITGLPYIRYERAQTQIDEVNVIRVKSFEDAAERAAQIEGNIFLATGSNSLEVFVKKIDNYKERLFVRVLPDSKIISKCEGMGLSANNIIAIKGPFSRELNIEMLRHCSARVLVTKDSGDVGGTAEKLHSAHALGIPVIVVHRPEIDYTKKVSSIEEVLNFVSVSSVYGSKR